MLFIFQNTFEQVQKQRYFFRLYLLYKVFINAIQTMKISGITVIKNWATSSEFHLVFKKKKVFLFVLHDNQSVIVVWHCNKADECAKMMWENWNGRRFIGSTCIENQKTLVKIKCVQCALCRINSTWKKMFDILHWKSVSD